MQVHWVGGYGMRKRLYAKELAAIQSAMQCYPDAEYYAHCAPDAWLDIEQKLPGIQRIEAEPSYMPKPPFNQGSGISDIVRLDMFTSPNWYGLYLDTDVFCLKPWPTALQLEGRDCFAMSALIGDSSGYAAAYKTVRGNRPINGIMFAGKPNCTFAEQWQKRAFKLSHNKRAIKIDTLSGALPAKLIQELSPIGKAVYDNRVRLFNGYASPTHAITMQEYEPSNPLHSFELNFSDAYFMHFHGTGRAFSAHPEGLVYSEMLKHCCLRQLVSLAEYNESLSAKQVQYQLGMLSDADAYEAELLSKQGSAGLTYDYKKRLLNVLQADVLTNWQWQDIKHSLGSCRTYAEISKCLNVSFNGRI